MPMVHQIKTNRSFANFWVWLFFALPCIVFFASSGHAQAGLNRADKLAQKIRIAAIEANRDILVSRITIDSLWAHRNDSNIILIDVREPAETAVSQLPNALSPLEFAAKFRQTGLPKGIRIITYCTIGYRSGKYAEQLIAKGIAAEFLEGGILAWVQAGHEVGRRQPDGKWSPSLEVHVYAKEWNLLPPNYKAIW